MISDTILSNMVFNEEFARKVAPHILPEYFESDHEKIIAKLILSHMGKFNRSPTKETLKIDLESKTLPEGIYDMAEEGIKNLSKEPIDLDWLYENTEKFCQERALQNALIEAVTRFDDKNEVGTIPDLLTKALAVSFDNHIGHDYFDDFESRFDFYNRKLDKVPFDIDLLNRITNGGVAKKTLSILLAGTAVGKSMAMCHLAASYLAIGKNVLYITMEMAEEYIAERIDANLLDVDISELRDIDGADFRKKVLKAKERNPGKLVIKEYPTGSAHVGHFRHLLTELKTKKKFTPDVIFVDYLNICSSAKFKVKNNMYEYSKSIAEELRGLAVEFNVVLWTATQTNREGYGSTDFDMTQTSESFGVPFTADLMLAMISTEELEKLNLLKFKQLKNRYGDVNYFKSFAVGVNRSRMRLYDAPDAAQSNITKDEGETAPEQKKGKNAARLFAA